MSDPTVNAIKTNARPRMGVKTMTSLAMLTAVAYVVMYLSKLLPQVLGFLQQLNKEGSTVILITHDNGIAATARRCVRLADGKIIEDHEQEVDWL